MTAPRHFDAHEVHQKLGYDTAITITRDAMIALSDGTARQLLRSFIARDAGVFAQMPAALSGTGYFGAKLISVFFEADGSRAHEGLVVLFDGASGKPVATADAGAITHIRTAAASAAATDALARSGADSMAVLGAGKQAASHIEAIARVRPLREIRVWGRTQAHAQRLAEEMARKTGIRVRSCATAREAVANAAIVCTVTSASEPVLEAGWIAPGTHINVVGSSGPGPVEIDTALVAGSRFIADHREHVLVHGAEFLKAKQAGVVGDDHIVAEIGEVFAGTKPGRTSGEEITIYKSLGHAVQDLAAAAWLYEHA